MVRLIERAIQLLLHSSCTSSHAHPEATCTVVILCRGSAAALSLNLAMKTALCGSNSSKLVRPPPSWSRALHKARASPCHPESLLSSITHSHSLTWMGIEAASACKVYDAIMYR
eukprot:2341377-Amphidinium_carterae.2